MARENKQFERNLRSRGVRRKVADDIARALGRRPKPKSSRKSISNLTTAVSEINDRLHGGPKKRSAAAKKGARTRKRNAEKRSEGAKRGARKQHAPKRTEGSTHSLAFRPRAIEEYSHAAIPQAA